MSTINPVLSSAALSVQSPMSNPVPNEELRLNEQSTTTSTQAGNSSVTLSEQASRMDPNAQNLNASQTVQDAAAPENRTAESQQQDSGLTYAASLQNQANYLQLNETAMPSEEESSQAKS